MRSLRIQASPTVVLWQLRWIFSIGTNSRLSLEPLFSFGFTSFGTQLWGSLCTLAELNHRKEKNEVRGGH